MNTSQILKKAEEMGIELECMVQRDLIKAIQKAEGKIDCYATDRNRTCEEEGCPWREGCLKPPKEMTHSLSETSAFVIRRLRNSVAVLSLIVENAKKHAKDESFLMYSFEALADQVKKIDEVIQICSHIPRGGKNLLQKLPARKPVTKTRKIKATAVKKRRSRSI